MFTGRQILKNTLLLTAAALLLRLLSMLFQAYLAGRIGAEGLGGVQLVLSVSAFAATLGLAGARVAASCLCAEAYGRRDSAGLQGAAAHCLGYVLLTSMLAAAGLFFAAPWIARYALRLPEAEGSLRLLAGLVPVGCVNLVLGGYLTAAGQVLRLTAVDACERVCCLGLSLLLLRSAPEGLGGACFALLGGDLLASCGAAAVLYGFYRQGWRGVSPSEAPPGLGRRVRKLAAPLALSDYLRAALRTLEQLLIPWGLAQAGASQQRAMAAYGTVTGMVFPVLMLPAAFLYALIDLLIPELAACRAQRRAARLQSVTRQCLRAGAAVRELYGGAAVRAGRAAGAALIPQRGGRAAAAAVCAGGAGLVSRRAGGRDAEGPFGAGRQRALQHHHVRAGRGAAVRAAAAVWTGRICLHVHRGASGQLRAEPAQAPARDRAAGLGGARLCGQRFWPRARARRRC